MNQKFFREKKLALPSRMATVAIVSVLLAAPAFAQQGGDATAAGMEPVFRWINFAIVFALIVWGFSKAGAHFRKNADDISKKIAEGTLARESAEKQRKEVQEKLAHIDDEVAQLRVDAKRAADAEGLRLRGMAKEEAQSIERAGQAEIAAAERGARIELKLLAGRLAVTQAEVVLREQMTPAAETGLFRAFMDELQRSKN